MPNPAPALYSILDIEERLGISRDRLERHIALGHLAPSVVRGKKGHRFFTRSDVRRFAQEVAGQKRLEAKDLIEKARAL